MSSTIGANSRIPSIDRARRGLKPALAALALCLAVDLGCGGAGDGSATGSGGSHQGGAGGTTGAAGTSGAAGTTGAAGTSATAGNTGASGTLGSAGTTGTGGVTGAGGTTGVAGTTGSAGTTGAAGASGAAGAAGNTGSGGSAAGAGGRGGAQGGRGGAAGSAGRGGAGTAGNGTGGAGTGGSSGGAGGAGMMSSGCGKTPALKNSPSATTFTYNTITSGGTARQYILRWPDNYDKGHPYRLIIGLHGATGSGKDVARTPAYFGLFDLSQGSTIFVAPDAAGGLWSAASDTTFVSDILKQVEADLCIDLTRVELEGFSQGAAMSWTLACSLPGTFRAAVGHSGGGVANPTTCQPIAYMGSLGLQEGNGQNTQTDQFARFNGCTVTTLPRAPTGGHVCTDYTGCPAGKPVRWCSYDGGHTPSPTDAGKTASWMPSEVWPFLSQF